MPKIQVSTGISIYYEWHGDDDGIPVVFIRGTGADSSRWMPQVNQYKEKYSTKSGSWRWIYERIFYYKIIYI